MLQTQHLDLLLMFTFLLGKHRLVLLSITLLLRLHDPFFELP